MTVDQEAFNAEMEAQKERAREARKALGDLGWERIDLGIEHRCTLQGAAAYFGVSYATARRWKQQACLALAYELGWIG